MKHFPMLGSLADGSGWSSYRLSRLGVRQFAEFVRVIWARIFCCTARKATWESI